MAQSQINLNKFNPNGDLVSAMAGAMPQFVESDKNQSSFIDKMKDFITNNVVGNDTIYVNETKGHFTYSEKQHRGGDLIVTTSDIRGNIESVSFNIPINLNIPFIDNSISIKPALTIGEDGIEKANEVSFKNGKTEETYSSNLGYKIGWDNISVFAEGGIEDKNSYSRTIKGEANIGSTEKVLGICTVAAGAIVLAASVVDPVPGDEGIGVAIIGNGIKMFIGK